MFVTLGTAARQCKVSKGTLSRAISSGKLSATRNEDGSWKIDNAELARYLEANQHRFRSEPVTTDQTETGDNPDPATDVLVAELRRMLDDLRTERDRLLTVIERLSLPVPQRAPDQSGPIPMPAPAEPKPEPGLLPRVRRTWRWLRTTG